MCIATVPPSRKETVPFDSPRVKDSIRWRARGHAGISLGLPPAIIELSDISRLVKIDHEAGPPRGHSLPAGTGGRTDGILTSRLPYTHDPDSHPASVNAVAFESANRAPSYNANHAVLQSSMSSVVSVPLRGSKSFMAAAVASEI
jgi:hypothetical protein